MSVNSTFYGSNNHYQALKMLRDHVITYMTTCVPGSNDHRLTYTNVRTTAFQHGVNS